MSSTIRGRQLDSYCRLSAERMLYFIVEVIGEAPAGIYVELFDRLPGAPTDPMSSRSKGGEPANGSFRCRFRLLLRFGVSEDRMANCRIAGRAWTLASSWSS
jgi:hypothetical protein